MTTPEAVPELDGAPLFLLDDLPDTEQLLLDGAEGRHAVLDDAVRLALDLLEAEPPATPPGYADVPDRSRPKLPPRSR